MDKKGKIASLEKRYESSENMKTSLQGFFEASEQGCTREWNGFVSI